MNEMSIPGISDTSRRDGLLRRRPRGQSAVEFAIIASTVLLFLLAAVDIGRVFYVDVALNNAVRAGAQYGSQSLITAADSAGMATAVENDAVNVASLGTPSASLCTCETPLPSNSTACPTNYCTNNAGATYVTVTATAPFKTVTKYPGIPASTTLSATAVMQVQQ